MDSISLVLLRLRSVLHSLYINLVYVHVGRFWINITLVTLVWESHASHYTHSPCECLLHVHVHGTPQDNVPCRRATCTMFIGMERGWGDHMGRMECLCGGDDVPVWWG